MFSIVGYFPESLKLSKQKFLSTQNYVTVRTFNSTKIFLGAKEKMCGTLSTKAAFCRPLRCKVLQSFFLNVLNLVFLLLLGIADANKQRCNAAKGFGTAGEQSLELRGLGLKSLHSELAISKVKEPLSCLQAGRQETSSDVGSLIISTVMISVRPGEYLIDPHSAVACSFLDGYFCGPQRILLTAHPACSLFRTAVYPQEKRAR